MRRPRTEIRPDTELHRTEFWATHYEIVAGGEHRGSQEVIQAAYGIAAERLENYYFSLIQPEEEAYLITVQLVAGFDVGVQYVDCSDDGTEVRYSLGHADWTEREPLGYQSPHFALPAFRWDEVDLIARAVKRRSEEDAAIAMLLLFPSVYLVTNDNSMHVGQALLSAWQRILPASQSIEELVRNALENQSDSELTWRKDPELGWICDGRYSFRNPKTTMTNFEPRRFARIRSLLDALEREKE